MKAPLASFTRTIPAEKKPEQVAEILHREDPYLPLTFRPARARQGDFIYLVHRGKIIGRAEITRIESAPEAARREAVNPPAWSNWLIWYRGSWQQPPREIAVQGHQGVRYLETLGLKDLDREDWPETI